MRDSTSIRFLAMKSKIYTPLVWPLVHVELSWWGNIFRYNTWEEADERDWND